MHRGRKAASAERFAGLCQIGFSVGYYKSIDGKYMAEKVTVEKFLEMSEHRPVVDVRSPSELYEPPADTTLPFASL